MNTSREKKKEFYFLLTNQIKDENKPMKIGIEEKLLT
jgi:hypothetical protein